MEDTVIAVKKHLDVLRDGIQQLGIINAELTEDKIKAVRQANELKEHHIKQLEEIGKAAEVNAAIQATKEHLSLERPWRDVESLQPHLKAIGDRYQEIRLQLIDYQEKQAQKIETKIKRRNGFGSFCDKKSSFVLEPLKKARCATTEDAVYPRLLELENTNSLTQAEREANEKLDRAIAEETKIQTISFEFAEVFTNREIATPEEVEALVTELRDRLLNQLKDGVRIRIT